MKRKLHLLPTPLKPQRPRMQRLMRQNQPPLLLIVQPSFYQRQISSNILCGTSAPFLSFYDSTGTQATNADLSGLTITFAIWVYTG